MADYSQANYDSRYVLIQNVKPQVDAGRYAVKRRLGQPLAVSCEALRHGHDSIQVLLQYRQKGKKKWQEVLMHCQNKGLDLYEAEFVAEAIGAWEYRISAYTDFYENWLEGTSKKAVAGEDIRSEVLEGIQLLEACRDCAPKTKKKQFQRKLDEIQSLLVAEQKLELMAEEDCVALASNYPERDGFHCGESEVYPLWVDRVQAEWATWYEIFPRSAGQVEGKSGTFQDVQRLLPYFSENGFDVLYFTPIHPIGVQKRKGKNNSLVAGPDEPGSPYAIGAAEGGHFAVHPELGSLTDFDELVDAATAHGMEIALDIALNCSPDHEYLQKHDWFYKRPDGSIKYAENPPKKYEDIYPLNFECDDRKALWNEIRDMFLFWCSHGVFTFRVDNPHTKPIAFWEWCIAEVREKYPQAIFLSEAFTRPRLMELLAKIGFSQSYGYFTWREHKAEIEEYFDYLHNTDVSEYMITNVFTTTPDILPKHLQHAPPQMFRIRHALAGLLSPLIGMYSGYELCENIPVGPRDELMDSEKYEFKVRNYDDPSSIMPFISRINHIRRENPALQQVGNLKFCDISNEKMMAFVRHVEGNTLLVVLNLDPYATQSALMHVPMSVLGLEHGASYKLHDLMTDRVYEWAGSDNFVELRQDECPVHVFRVF